MTHSTTATSLALLSLALVACPGPAPSHRASNGGGGSGAGGTTSDGGSGLEGGTAPGGGGEGGAATCGNGQLDPRETCDDGDVADDDGCSATCLEEAGWDCDGGSPTVCDEICGDTMVVGDEECDEGDVVPGDGCSAECRNEECGNGAVDPGMLCFHPGVPYAGSIQAALADLNGDSLPDLVQWGGMFWAQKALTVRLSDVSNPGAFGAPQTLKSFAGHDLFHPAFGQIDGDGLLDLVLTPHDINSNTIEMALNDSMAPGTLAAPQTTGITNMVADGRVFVADLDGQHGDDLLMTGCGSGCPTGDNNLRIYLAQPGGGFTETQNVPAGNAVHIFVADFSGDGSPDAVLPFQSGLGLYTSDGNGTFSGPTSFPYPSALAFYPYGGAIGDVNGDGHLDLAVSAFSTTSPPVPNPPIHIMLGGMGATFASGGSLPTVGGGSLVAMGDVDNDGLDDVLNPNAAGAMEWHRSTGAGGFEAPDTLFTGCPSSDGCRATVADLDGDGANDVIVTNATADGVVVYLSDP